MKPPIPILLASVILSGCQTRFTPEQELIAWNGVIRQGSTVSVTHARPGVYPSETLAYANEKLSIRIREITHDSGADCFIVPTIGGYNIVILSKHYLTTTENEQMHKYVSDALETAWKDTEIYRKKEE